jgi:hypothetical protein
LIQQALGSMGILSSDEIDDFREIIVGCLSPPNRPE